MKNLAELKRTIKPGTRLRCIENTKRPELNGRIRIVCRVQGNAFTWRHEEPLPTEDSRESWTYYPKAALCEFDGTSTVKMAAGDAYGSDPRFHVRLEVL